MNAIALAYFEIAAGIFLWLGFSAAAFESRAEMYQELGGRTPLMALAWFTVLAIACFLWPFSIGAWLTEREEEDL